MASVLLAMSALFISAPSLADHDKEEQDVFGWVEKTTIEPWNIEVKAKLDSGALTSSLDARNIEEFKKGDVPWVRFDLELTDEETGEVFEKHLEKPVYRDMAVRGAGGRDPRLVVLMKICMGDTIHEEQFSLRDREDMIYPVLLGRRTIGELGLLNVNKTFITDPTCDEDSQVIEHHGEGEYGNVKEHLDDADENHDADEDHDAKSDDAESNRDDA
ncbi:ATP-dependent zinc protease [Halomonas binhaiensis]|uniref:ATP-dependent zinc protease n=2 Tax=Halomonas binhaiensis TaxID=2562282 RepID=A0A5C1NKW6_9GAMM|nr:ATP-dependent zinc protease [Halomonas binhaiensis]